MTRSLARFFVHFAVVAVTTLVLLELALRALGYSTIYFYDPIYRPFSTGDTRIPFVMKANLRDARAHGNIRINTDELGLRSLVAGQTHAAKTSDEFRIAVVGDSVTFGYGVETPHVYASVMEKLLNESGLACRTTVFNFGTSSYSVKEMAATVAERVSSVDPDLIVVGMIYGDYDTSRTPGIDQFGYNTHGESSRFFSRFPYLKSLLRELHLSYAIRDAIAALRAHSKPAMQLDTLPDSYRYLLEITEFSKEKGVPCIVLTLPSSGSDGTEFVKTIEALQRDGIDYCDVSSIARDFTPHDYRASRFDFHPSKAVHERIAKMLTGYILKAHIPQNCRK